MKTFKDWMEEGRVTSGFKNCERLLFADGNSISVQASSFHYCSPRTDCNSYNDYKAFEVGFPSRHFHNLDAFQDGPGDPLDSVYGWVPDTVIELIVKECGGIVGFVCLS